MHYIFQFEQDLTHLAFSFIFLLIYLELGVLLPTSKHIHYTLYFLQMNVFLYKKTFYKKLSLKNSTSWAAFFKSCDFS